MFIDNVVSVGRTQIINWEIMSVARTDSRLDGSERDIIIRWSMDNSDGEMS